jgi:ABC-type transporter Mla subunit MlaD
MRRILLTLVCLAVPALVIAWPATGDDGGPYLVRAYFDNGSFVVNDEEVRIAGATVGLVKSVDVSRDDEVVSAADCPRGEPSFDCGTEVPGKAVVVLEIDDDGFKDFLQDASCLIRPQSLIGERFVDCTPTNPRAPGSEAPPELEKIPDGEHGAGQRWLPLENNGKAVDIDLINNIQRVPYRDRFRIILNELGAALAARGDDLAVVVDRANPALRQTNRVLAILAQQNKALADLASNGDEVLQPLAENRSSITGFFRQATIAGQAAAERSPQIEEGLQKFPRTLRELRLTMVELRKFADEGTPLSEDIGASAKDFSRATQKLSPFAQASIPAFDTLGDAAQASGPKLVDADPVLRDLITLNDSVAPGAKSLAALLDTFKKTKGFEYLMDFIYNQGGSVNGFDQFGHFQRASLQVTACNGYVAVVFSGCEAKFLHIKDGKKKKKKQKTKKSAIERPAATGTRAPSAQTAPPAQPAPDLGELVPPLQQPPGAIEPDPDPGQGTQTTPDPEITAPSDAQAARLFSRYAGDGKPMTIRETRLLLRFLFGATA